MEVLVKTLLAGGIEWRGARLTPSATGLLVELARRTTSRPGEAVEAGREHLRARAGRGLAPATLSRALAQLVELQLVRRERRPPQAGLRPQRGQIKEDVARTWISPVLIVAAEAWQARRRALRAQGKRGREAYPAPIALALPLPAPFGTVPAPGSEGPRSGAEGATHGRTENPPAAEAPPRKPSIHAGSHGSSSSKRATRVAQNEPGCIHTPPTSAPGPATAREEAAAAGGTPFPWPQESHSPGVAGGGVPNPPGNVSKKDELEKDELEKDESEKAAQRGAGRAPSGGNTGPASAGRGFPGAPPEAEIALKVPVCEADLHPFRQTLIREARALTGWFHQAHALGGHGPGSAGRDHFSRIVGLRCDRDGNYGRGERPIVWDGVNHSARAIKPSERSGLLLTVWNSIFNAVFSKTRQLQNAEEPEFLGESLFVGPIDGSRIVLLDDVKSPEPVLVGHACAVIETSTGNYQQLYVAARDLTNKERHILQKRCCALIWGKGANADAGATAGHQLHRWPGSVNWKPGRNQFITRLVRLEFAGARLDCANLDLRESVEVSEVEDAGEVNSNTCDIGISRVHRVRGKVNPGAGGARNTESELDWAVACRAAGLPGATVETVAAAVAARRGEGLAAKAPDYPERTSVRALWQVQHGSLDQFPSGWRSGVRYR